MRRVVFAAFIDYAEVAFLGGSRVGADCVDFPGHEIPGIAGANAETSFECGVDLLMRFGSRTESIRHGGLPEVALGAELV